MTAACVIVEGSETSAQFGKLDWAAVGKKLVFSGSLSAIADTNN